MTKPQVVRELRSSKDHGLLRGRKMFNWTVISDMSRGIANTTDSVGAESITMSPVMAEIALELKTSRGGVSQHRQVAMRARVGGAILSIVAEMMTPKAFSQRTSRSRSKSVWARKYPSGGGEYVSAIKESNMLGGIPRDWESPIVRVS